MNILNDYIILHINYKALKKELWKLLNFWRSQEKQSSQFPFKSASIQAQKYGRSSRAPVVISLPFYHATLSQSSCCRALL